MGILIKGMEMPTSCQSCFANEYQTCIFADKNASVNGKLLDCPLAPVPPHGRLIDADAFLRTIRPICDEDAYKGCTFETVKRLMIEHINNAPTIIEAEEGER